MSLNGKIMNAIRIVIGINIVILLIFCLALSGDILEYLPGYRKQYSVSQNVASVKTLTTKTNETWVPCLPEDKYNISIGKRVTNVAFLKVHKAGSTTMQNLFFRFGLRYKLNILVPKSGHQLYNMKKLVPLKPAYSYNIFASHARYSKDDFDRLIPTGSVKIGIVREPVDRLVSAAYYYRDVQRVYHLKIIPEDNFIHNLIQFPEKYNTKSFSQTRNAMGYDFGFPENIKTNDTEKINSFLKSLNSDFLLVLIVDKFDESLVMMKRYLSWSFLDIIYLKSNSHDHKPVELSGEERDKVRETNFLDYALYKYFTEEFDKKLRTMSEDFDQEVEYFRDILNEVFLFCSKDDIDNDSELFVGSSFWDDAFVLLGVECKWMKTKEVLFINQIRQKTRALWVNKRQQ